MSTSSLMKAVLTVLAVSVTLHGVVATPLPGVETTAIDAPYAKRVASPDVDTETVTIPSVKRFDDSETVTVPYNVTKRDLSERKTVPKLRLGTNTAPDVKGSNKGGFGLTGDAFTDLVSFSSNPSGFSYMDAAKKVTCNYDVYGSYVPGQGGTNNVFYNDDAWFNVNEVNQRLVGDCGFGAAMMALRDTNSGALKTLFSQIDGDTLIANFRIGGEDVVVNMDGKLPTLNGATSTFGQCLPQLGSFQIVNNNAYVPMAEKAFAKLLDAYPTLRSSSGAGKSGYEALTGVRSFVVMRAITGNKGLRIDHKPVGTKHSYFDQNYSDTLINCLNAPFPCTIATPSHSGLANIYQLSDSTGYSNSAAKHIQFTGDFITFNDVDQGGKAVRLVANHWYSLIKSKSPHVKPNKANANSNKILVTLRNPWGYNPTFANPNIQGDAEVQVSLRAIYAVTTEINTIKDSGFT